MLSLTDNLEASIHLTRGLSPAAANAALTRARRRARDIRLLQEALAEQAQHRRFLGNLFDLGRVARAAGFTNTVRQIARLAREHRAQHTLARQTVAILVEDVRR